MILGATLAASGVEAVDHFLNTFLEIFLSSALPQWGQYKTLNYSQVLLAFCFLGTGTCVVG